jgi:hypothetical protein
LQVFVRTSQGDWGPGAALQSAGSAAAVPKLVMELDDPPRQFTSPGGSTNAPSASLPVRIQP